MQGWAGWVGQHLRWLRPCRCARPAWAGGTKPCAQLCHQDRLTAHPQMWQLVPPRAQGHILFPLTHSGREEPLGLDFLSCDLLKKHITQHNSAPVAGLPGASQVSLQALWRGLQLQDAQPRQFICFADNPWAGGAETRTEGACPHTHQPHECGHAGEQLHRPCNRMGGPITCPWLGTEQHRPWLRMEWLGMCAVPGQGLALAKFSSGQQRFSFHHEFSFTCSTETPRVAMCT